VTALAIAGTAAALLATGAFDSGSSSDKSTTVIVRDPAATAPAAKPAPRTTTQPAAPPDDTTVADTDTYTTDTYSADYPSGWSVTEDDVDKGAYSETKIESPGGGATVLIDRTPGSPQDPQAQAEGVERDTATTPGYRRISFGTADLGGRPGFIWVFELPSGRRVDFFTNAGGGRFAILGHGTDFATAESAARTVAETLR
jgi:hypothetical protein